MPLTFGQLDRRAAEPVQELIPGLIEKGVVTFLSAPGGTHKSRIGVHWGRCLHHGLPIYGREVQRAHFIYVSCEDDINEVTIRAQVLKRRLDLPEQDDSQYWNLVGEDAPLATVEESGSCKLQPFWKTLTDELRAIPGHKFIVLDGTYNMLRFAGQAEDQRDLCAGRHQAAAAPLHLHRLDGASRLWHPSQAGQERGDASGWSVAWHNAPRAAEPGRPSRGREDAFELKVEKRNHGAKGEADHPVLVRRHVAFLASRPPWRRTRTTSSGSSSMPCDRSSQGRHPVDLTAQPHSEAHSRNSPRTPGDGRSPTRRVKAHAAPRSIHRRPCVRLWQ